MRIIPLAVAVVAVAPWASGQATNPPAPSPATIIVAKPTVAEGKLVWTERREVEVAEPVVVQKVIEGKVVAITELKTVRKFVAVERNAGLASCRAWDAAGKAVACEARPLGDAIRDASAVVVVAGQKVPDGLPALLKAGTLVIEAP